MSLKQQVLDYAITHWQNNFTGISAISIADELTYSHEDILAVLEELSNEGHGSLRKDVKLYRLSMTQDGSAWYGDAQEIVTSIFFPAKELLTETFYSGSLGRQNLPEYAVRLHMGYSQIHFYYFSQAVLKKYLDHPEVYDVEDTIAGGILSLNDEYLEKHESNDELEGVMFIRYGKRLRADGQVAVTAILHDLSEMPASEQSYWRSFELNKPDFDQDDPDFEKFYRRNFEAEWIDYDDPLENALNEINRLNTILNASFFSRDQNAYLTYPVACTYKNFCDSCSELYKLFGPDNINIKVLKGLLLNQLGYTENEFVHTGSGRSLSKLQLLDLLSQNISSVSALINVIKEIKGYRVSADHRIIDPKTPIMNYINEFRRICEDLYSALTMFADEFDRLLND